MEKLLKRAAAYVRCGALDDAIADIKLYERSLPVKVQYIQRLRRKILRAQKHLWKIAERMETEGSVSPT